MSCLAPMWQPFLRLFSRWRSPAAQPLRRYRYCQLWLERLENRLAPAAHDTLSTAIPLNFDAGPTAAASAAIADPNQVDLYAVTMAAGDQLSASVNAQQQGSTLFAGLRLFDDNGNELTVGSNGISGDPALSYRALASGTYFVGISSYGNLAYSATSSDSGSNGSSSGVYALSVNDLAARFVNAVALTNQEQGTLAAGQPQDYVINVQGGDTFLFANALPLLSPGFEPRLTLYDGTGKMLIQSDQHAPGLAGAVLQQHLEVRPSLSLTGGSAGQNYYLEVSAAPSTAAGSLESYQLTTTLADSIPPQTSLPLRTPTDGIPAPTSVAVATDPGTGHPVIVTTNQSGTATVLLGNGDGTFQPAQSFTLGTAPFQLVDLGTGHLDIVTNNGDGTVSVLLGNGAGAFQPAQPFDVGIGSFALVVADLGNGHPDIITANFSDGSVTVLLGDGSGTSFTRQDYFVGGGPLAVAVADLGNGHRDIVTANYWDNSVSVLLGDGTGQSFTRNDYFVGQGPAAVALAQLGNGHMDIVTANYGDNSVSVLLGDGTGTAFARNDFLVGSGPVSVQVANFGLDHPEIITANRTALSMSVLADDGTGTSFKRTDVDVINPDMVAVGNLGNGHADLVDVNKGGNQATVWLGDGAGTFQPHTYAAGLTPNALALADLGTGRLDIVVTNFNDGQVSLLRGRGDGTFQPAPALAVGAQPEGVAVADLGNGFADLVVSDFGANTVSVFLGNGAGAFKPIGTYPVGLEPEAVVLKDLLGNGKMDIVTVNNGDNTVSVLLGNGDGTFQPARSFPVGISPFGLAVADLGNGHQDIVTANTSGTVTVLLGTGQGDFQFSQTLQAGSGAVAVTVADLGNGHQDIVSADQFANTVTVWFGDGNGQFRNSKTFAVGSQPTSVAVADLGNGQSDIVTANYGDNTDSVLLGDGAGNFTPDPNSPQGYAPGAFPAGSVPDKLAVADLGNGQMDIVTTNFHDGRVSVLLGTGNAMFQAPTFYAGGFGNGALVVADLGNGFQDVVTANFSNGAATGSLGNSVSVLLGYGDGTFQQAQIIPVGSGPIAQDTADLGNGQIDLVTTDFLTHQVSVSLGNGDGSFKFAQSYDVGNGPMAVSVMDVNGDGRPDIVTANEVDNTVSVLLGNGDGTFQPAQTLAVGLAPVAVAVADLGNGHRDIVTANAGADTVSVLLGNGDGSFQPARSYAVGSEPVALALADLGNGHPDIVTANFGASIVNNSLGGTVSVLLGDGSGTSFLRNDVFVYYGFAPLAVAIGYLGDAHPDLIVAGIDPFFNSSYVAILAGDGAGAFQSPQFYQVGNLPYSMTVTTAGLGNAHTDIVTANYGESTVGILLGNGDGTFQSFPSVDVGGLPEAIAVVDVNGDGQIDILTANAGSDSTQTVLVNLGNLQFQPPATTAGLSTIDAPQLKHPTDVPQLQDLTGDSIPDALTIDQRTGKILYRQGTGNPANPYAPLVVVNQQRLSHIRPGGGRHPLTVRATDFTLVQTSGLPEIAALDALDQLVNIYSWSAAVASFQLIGSFATGPEPICIASADLNGDRLGDIVVGNARDNTLTIALQTSFGQFTTLTRGIGNGPSSITFAARDAQNGPDIVVSGQVSGDVSILINDAGHAFLTQERYRAGQMPFETNPSSNGSATLLTTLETVSVVAGAFTGAAAPDLIALNAGADSFSLLRSAGGGSLIDPQIADTYTVAQGAVQALARNFLHHSLEDVAVLTTAADGASQVWVYPNNGDGAFAAPIESDAGQGATGFSFIPGRGGQPDRLLVGNAYGDVLTLLGDGKGHFSVDRGNLQGEPLAVGKTADGREFAVVADQGQDKVQVYYRIPGTDQFAAPVPIDSHDPTLLAPGAVQLINLAKNNLPDLVVASRLGNDILVYPGLPDGTFGPPTSFPVGFEPVSFTAGYLKGNHVLDLAVANEGSNDVSILLGAIDPATGQWTASAGPRLQSGGSEPLSIQVGNFLGNGLPDLRVINRGGQIATIPGIGAAGAGTGFFNDTHLQPVDLGATITQALFDPATGQELLVSNGGISAFAGNGFTEVFPAGAGVTTIGLEGDTLAAAFDDGSVGLFKQDANSSFTPASEADVFLDNVSALQVVQGANGVEVYVTRTGSEAPQILSGADFISVATDLPAGGVLAQTFSLPGADLVLVTILLTGAAPDAVGNGNGASAGEVAFAAFSPAILFQVQAQGDNPHEPGTEEFVVTVPVAVGAGGRQAAWEEFRTGVEEAFQRQHWLREGQPLSREAVEILRQLFDQIQQWWLNQPQPRQGASVAPAAPALTQALSLIDEPVRPCELIASEVDPVPCLRFAAVDADAQGKPDDKDLTAKSGLALGLLLLPALPMLLANDAQPAPKSLNQRSRRLAQQG